MKTSTNNRPPDGDIRGAGGEPTVFCRGGDTVNSRSKRRTHQGDGTIGVNQHDAWVFSRLIKVMDVAPGDIEAMDAPFRDIAERLVNSAPDDRQKVFGDLLHQRPEIDADELHRLVMDVDPRGLAPAVEGEGDASFSTLADVMKIMAEQVWLWLGWLPAAVLTAIAAEPGTGKTRFVLDLARRLWFGLRFPDGQDNPHPEKTRTLWVPGDQNHAELVTAARDFGLPPEAVVIAAPPDNPFGCLDLDDPQNLVDLEARIKASGCPVVVVDTVGMTTGRNLCKPEDARDYFSSLMGIARRTKVAMICVTHLSKGGDPLGRRIVEKARSVIKLTCPDPEGQPNRRKLWVDKTATLKPPALGVTMGTNGNEYDDAPPQAPVDAIGRPGPAPERQTECASWLREQLTPNPARVSELRQEAEQKGFPVGTLYRAKDGIGVDEYKVDNRKWWRLPPDPDDATDGVVHVQDSTSL